MFHKVLGSILVLALGLFVSVPAMAQDCDPAEYANGTDITEMLRGDLECGLDVTLPGGTFYLTETIVVLGYSGTVQGTLDDEGNRLTIIKNDPDRAFLAGSDPLFPPEYRLTEMIALYEITGDVTIRDIAFRIVGDAPARTHNSPFFGRVKTIDNVIVIAGVSHDDDVNGATVTYEGLEITGAASSRGSVNGMNVAIPLLATGSYGADKPLYTVVRDCAITNFGSANEFTHMDGFTIEDTEVTNGQQYGLVVNRVDSALVEGNNFSTTSGTCDLVVIRSSDVEVSGHNTFSGNYEWAAIFAYLTDNMTIADNVFEDIQVVTDAPISLQRCTDTDVTRNGFTNCFGGGAGGVWLIDTSTTDVWNNDFDTVMGPAVWVYNYWAEPSTGNTIGQNDYSDSGIPGLPGAPCIQLGDSFGSVEGNHVIESLNPTGMTFPIGTDLCTQVRDYSDDPDTGWYDGLNQISGVDACAN